MYTIYHVVGKKVGCTVNFRQRLRHYQGLEVKVLEELDDSVGDHFAGDREHYWADHFGYRRYNHYTRNWNYNITIEQRREAGRLGGKTGIGGKRSFELGVGIHSFTIEEKIEAARKGGKVGGKRIAELGKSVFKQSAVQKELGQRAAKSSGHPNNRTDSCPHCGKSMNLGNLSKYHLNGRCPQVRALSDGKIEISALENVR
jgi:hypothetical protein